MGTAPLWMSETETLVCKDEVMVVCPALAQNSNYSSLEVCDPWCPLPLSVREKENHG